MSLHSAETKVSSWVVGVREAVPLLGGYIPVAVAFGLMAAQAGFGVWEAGAVSVLIYAGASQFLFVGMIASGAPLWLVVAMSLLINARHVVYGPNLAQWLPRSSWWAWLMHGLTDQIFALAHTRLPHLQASERVAWFTGAMLTAWFSWIGGTVLGVVAGAELTQRWPLLGQIMPFALPALFLVLLAPRFSSWPWVMALGCTILTALGLKFSGLPNAAIPIAAAFGAVLFLMSDAKAKKKVGVHG